MPWHLRQKHLGVSRRSCSWTSSDFASDASSDARAQHTQPDRKRKTLRPFRSIKHRSRLSPEPTASTFPHWILRDRCSVSQKLQNSLFKPFSFISRHLHRHSNLNSDPSAPEPSCPHRTVVDFGRPDGNMCEGQWKSKIPEASEMRNQNPTKKQGIIFQ